MPSNRNTQSLTALKSQLENAKALIFADYSGLSVSDQGQLRNRIAVSKGAYMVAKNNLLRLALKDKFGEVPAEVDSMLNGPTAVVIAHEDAVTTTKAVTEFIKDKEKLALKVGFMDGKVLSLEEIKTLSKLPGRLELLSSLLAQLQAPAQALVRQLAAPAQRLVYALEAIKNK